MVCGIGMGTTQQLCTKSVSSGGEMAFASVPSPPLVTAEAQ
jgi:hypothetical protein